MPTVTDPQNGCVYSWEGRSNSMVRMENKVLLLTDWVPLRISIHRKLLSRFLEAETEHGLYSLASRIAFVTRELSQVKPRQSRELVSRPIAKRLVAGRVSVPLKTWTELQKFFAVSRTDGSDLAHIAAMISIMFFCGSIPLRRLTSPARGRWAANLVLGDHLPAAYFACRELVVMSKASDGLYRLIKCALEELAVRDQRAGSFLDDAKTRPESYQDQIFFVLLVYRAFEGAWEYCGVDGLGEPQQLSMKYLYRQKGLRTFYQKITRHDPAVFARIFEHWISLYLSEPGAAAKRLALGRPKA